MKLKICLMGLLCTIFHGYSQHKTLPNDLMPGDQMPNVFISHIANSNIKSAKISDFSGKVVILDFWCTSCGGCVQSLPEMDSLQRIYKAKLQILAVNSKRCLDNEKSVQRILDVTNSWSNRKFKVPIVLADTALTDLFNFRGVPYIVWISPNGKILALTGKPEVNKNNIERALAGQKIVAVDKNDKRIRL